MVRSAARLGDPLRDEIERHAGARMPIAEICRRVGLVADRLGQPRPSYERIRVLVHESRERSSSPGAAELAVDIAFRFHPPTAALEYLSGTGPAK